MPDYDSLLNFVDRIAHMTPYQYDDDGEEPDFVDAAETMNAIIHIARSLMETR